MGHKVHPTGFRLGVIRDWQAKWYADKHYAALLEEDLKIRKAIDSRYAEAAISLVETDRQANQVSVTIHTARPGIVIGRGGQRVDETRRHLEKLIGKRIQLNIMEIQQPELDAHLVAKAIAEQMQRRIAFRRAMKQAMTRTIQAGAKGIRICCAGRLGGAEIARRLVMREGRVPLHTLRADIDYGFTEARTVMGRIGVKIWIYKGDILPEVKVPEVEEVAAEVAPAAELAEKPVEALVGVSSSGEAPPPSAETVLAEAVTAVGTEAAPPAKKPAKPTRRRAKAVTPSAEVVPVEPVTAVGTEATPPAEKPAKPTRRRAKAVTPSEAGESNVTT